MTVRIGVDAGGSHTEAVLDRDGGTIRAATGPGAVRPGEEERAVRQWIEAVGAVLARAGMPIGPVSVVVGAAGSGRSGLSPTLESAAAKALPTGSRVRVVTDGLIALEAAFPGGAPGIVVMAGSGSIAYGRDANGAIRRVGGYGWRMSDEGSGYALGAAALRRIARSLDGRDAPTTFEDTVVRDLGLPTAEALVAWSVAAAPGEVAALAGTIGHAAAAGDPAAVALVAEAARDLATLAAALVPHVAGSGSVSVALGGGMLRPDSALRAPTIQYLTELAPGAGVLDAAVDPPLGALRLAGTL